MGQQQLLLLILVSIIVGVMTVVAITLFADASNEGVMDIIRQDMMESATVGQMYYKKHAGMGGGGESFVNISLTDILLADSTAVSTFVISETSKEYFKITATPLNGMDPFTAVVYSDRVVWE